MSGKTAWCRAFAMIIALLGLPQYLTPASAKTSSTIPPGLRELAIHHVQISVADADRLAAWYVQTLGFRITKRATAPGVKIVWIDIPGFRLGLAQVDGSARPNVASAVPPADVMTQGYRQIHFSVPDVDAAYAALQQLGVSFALAPRNYDLTGIRIASFADPEGNVISIYQDLVPGNALMALPGR